MNTLSSEVKNKIQTATKVVILSHRSPDGDSVGSSLALYHYLKQKIDTVTVITPDPAPTFLHWLPDFNKVLNFEEKQEEVSERIAEAQIVFCLDFNALYRMGEGLKTEVEKNKNAYLINIDHHQEPDDFANFQWIDTKASSTAQLIFDFVEQLSSKTAINQDMAYCIYTGILTDTGSFRFSSTTAKTHETVAHLINTGIDSSRIYQNIYDNYSVDRLHLLGFALNKKLNINQKHSFAIISLTADEMKQFNFKKGDTEGLVNYPLSVASIKVAVLATEKEGQIRLSFRSKDEVAVNSLANKYFSGGGHINAAGGISDLSMEETLKSLEEKLIEHLPVC